MGVRGSSYRKPGAFMLFNERGERFGLLSGGCLEADLQHHARKVMWSGEATTLEYDTTDDGGAGFRLGLGCGGVIEILLQPIKKEQNYLGLHQLLQTLQDHQPVVYRQEITRIKARIQVDSSVSADTSAFVAQDKHQSLHKSLHEGPHEGLHKSLHTRYNVEDCGTHIEATCCIPPPPHLLIVGGGVDAAPLVALATTMGWTVTLADPRPSQAQSKYFGGHRIYRGPLSEMAAQPWFESIDASVLMAHNIDIDADAIAALRTSDLSYCAMLGPEIRKRYVLDQAQVLESDFPCPIYGPAGLVLGGELPESVALSILSQAHAVLFGAIQQAVPDESELLERSTGT